MVGRHQLRVKVFQALYSMESDRSSSSNARKQLFRSIEGIYDLYISLFTLLVALRDWEEEKLEMAKKRRLLTDKDLNPNRAFVDNKIFHLLAINEQINKHLDKNSQLNWSQHDGVIEKLLTNIKTSKLYENYMQKSEQSFSADKRFVKELYQEFIEDNELILDITEEQNMHWADDIDIANNMVVNSIDSFTKSSDASFKLFKVYRGEDDQDFVARLFDATRDHWDELEKIITEKAKNWDFDRIARTDRLLMKMGICEILYLKDIPVNVSINEYVELSKYYSSEKSKSFINGILDRVAKEISK